jgi:hypothetical protein
MYGRYSWLSQKYSKQTLRAWQTQIPALDWVTQGSLSQSSQGNWRWTLLTVQPRRNPRLTCSFDQSRFKYSATP